MKAEHSSRNSDPAFVHCQPGQIKVSCTHLTRHHGLPSRGGFTLVEMMVAAAISMLILTLLLSIFSGILESWNQTSARSETFNEARAALHLLDRDLDAVVPVGALPLVSTGLKNPKAEGLEAFGFVGRVSPSLQPVTNAALPSGTDLNVSDICGVVYFLAPDTDKNNAPHALFRRLIPSKSTYGLLPLPDGFFTAACAADAETTLAAEDEIVAQNVIDMKVSFRDADFKMIDATQVPPDGNPLVPAYLEVVLKVIDSRSAQIFFDPAAGTNAKQEMAQKNAREFTVRHRL